MMMKEASSLWVRYSLMDKDEVIKRIKWRRSHSFVQQFLEVMEAQARASSKTVRDVIGNTQTVYAGTSQTPFMSLAASATNSVYGVVVGTGTLVGSNSSFQMDNKVNHGTSTGQLYYYDTLFTEPIVSGGNVDLVVGRTFQNQTGSTIYLHEIGLLSYHYNNLYLLLARDLMDITINPTITAFVEYRARTTI